MPALRTYTLTRVCPIPRMVSTPVPLYAANRVSAASAMRAASGTSPGRSTPSTGTHHRIDPRTGPLDEAQRAMQPFRFCSVLRLMELLVVALIGGSALLAFLAAIEPAAPPLYRRPPTPPDGTDRFSTRAARPGTADRN